LLISMPQTGLEGVANKCIACIALIAATDGRPKFEMSDHGHNRPLLLPRQVDKVWADSTVARIVLLTEEASAGRPKLQKWVDKFGERYSQVVVALSALVAVVGPLAFGWPLFGRGENPGAIYRALGLMVAMSPCALAAAPLSYVAGIR
jgi:cation transport ATPase